MYIVTVCECDHLRSSPGGLARRLSGGNKRSNIGSSRMWCLRMWCLIIIAMLRFYSHSLINNSCEMYYYQTPHPRTPHP